MSDQVTGALNVGISLGMFDRKTAYAGKVIQWFNKGVF